MSELKKITPEELAEVLKAHSTWLMSGGEYGAYADLSYTDLRGTDLQGALLESAKLEGADLRGVNLRRAQLTEAGLQRTNLEGADLLGTHLSGASFWDALLSGANLSKADLHEADLSGADLSQADLTVANLSQADLTGANLSDADLSGAKLPFANLSKADLTGANLTGVNLIGTDLPLETLRSSNKTVDNDALSQELRDAQRRERELQQKYEAVSRKLMEASSSEGETEKLKQERNTLEAEKKAAAKETEVLRGQFEQSVKKAKELAELNAHLMDEAVKDAVKEMRGSVEAAREAKDFNFMLSKFFIGIGAVCYVAAVGYLVYLFSTDTCETSFGLIKDGVTTVQNGWQIIPLYLPVVALLSMGTAFFRHESKIRSQTSFLLEQISHAEKAAGLLNIATNLESIPDDKLERIILPTFIDIRRSLLHMAVEPPKKDEKDAPLTLSQYKTMADTVGKALKIGVDKN